MDDSPQTLAVAPRRSVGDGDGGAVLVHIYPTGPGMGTRYTLGGRAVTLGRGDDCDIRINDSSVSRHHARIDPGEDGYWVADLGSTNGTFVNDIAAPRRLRDGEYLRLGGCIFRFLSGQNVEAQYHEEIYQLVISDALTGLANKRCLLEALDRELARSARYRRPLSLVLFDLDHFKTVNDTHGHLAGDYTLRELAARVRTTVRKEELLARYGGEEFALLLPETTAEDAGRVAERVRALVSEEPFRYEGKCYSVTVSAGVATASGATSMTPDELLRQADEKLYEAKRQGRNRVVV